LVTFVALLSLVYAQTQLWTTTQTGSGTYYGVQTGAGGACSIYPRPAFMSSLSTVAMNSPQFGLGLAASMSCGMCVQVIGTGSGSGANPISTSKSFVAVVDDLCPECKSGDLDLAKAGDGRWGISWVAVDCPVTGNLQYLFQGSNTYYLKLQVRNHRIPIKAVDFLGKDGKYYSGQRTSDNFFEVPSYPYPVTFPLQVRVTGLYGNPVIDKVPKLSTTVMNGQNGVQVTGIKAAKAVGEGDDGTSIITTDFPEFKAVAADGSSLVSSPATPSSNLDTVLVGVVVGAGCILLAVVVVSIVLLHKANSRRMLAENQP